MKPGKMSKIAGVVLSLVLLVGMAGMPAPALANNGAVILTPGWVSGNVTVSGYQLTQVTVRAMDTEGVFSASETFEAPGGASKIEYNLTVESEPTAEVPREYYVIAEAQVDSTDSTQVIVPLTGSVTVPVGATVTQDLSVDPAFISGTISTTTDGSNAIEEFRIYARIQPPEFDGMYFYNTTRALGLSVPGHPDGRDYTLLVAPGLVYDFYAYITVNGIQYYFPREIPKPTAPAAGGTLVRDFTIEVTSATISGNATLLGTATDVYNAEVAGYEYTPPIRSVTTTIDNISTGNYTLDVTAGTWHVAPEFKFHLTPSNLRDLYGFLSPPRTEVTLAAGENVTQDFIIDPGFITGNVTLTGANTDISSGQIRSFSSPNGYMDARIHGDTGEYMLVASPGDWWYKYLWLYFPYLGDLDTSLTSNLRLDDFIPPRSFTVTSGDTVSDVNLTYGTATVRLYYYVAGGGLLSSPYFDAERAETPETPYLIAHASGSAIPTTEGQAIGTLFPGTYTIEAFATVGGSDTEFGTFTVTVEEGWVVVIGGLARPTITVTNPTHGAEIPADSVTVEGTATDDVGIASIYINGEEVTLTSTGGPDNEVEFSHEVSLPVIGENTITLVATDTDGTPPVTLTLTVTRTEVTTTPTTLTYTGDTSVQVNTAATLSAMLEDEGGEPISDATISFQVDDQIYTAVTDTDGVASCEVTAPPTAGVYEITVQYAGDTQHQGSTATASLTVYTPTTLTYTGDTLVPVNTTATLEAILVDEGGEPISGATISFQVDGLSFEADTDIDGVASFEVTAPPTASVFEITAEFAGDALHQASTATAIGAVYDPDDPEGGFVTGGGWIDSPEGAYAEDPTLTGRANFGFVSKYKKGADVPTGQTEFQFQVADLNFHSDTYQWLVVAGARAQYKGTGTINGAGNYGFMLTAIDAKLTPSTDVDKFRIKIWDKDTDAIVYDNQMDTADGVDPTTSIAGGNIVIHKG